MKPLIAAIVTITALGAILIKGSTNEIKKHKAYTLRTWEKLLAEETDPALRKQIEGYIEKTKKW